jgi:hypothetical protein
MFMPVRLSLRWKSLLILPDPKAGGRAGRACLAQACAARLATAAIAFVWTSRAMGCPTPVNSMLTPDRADRPPIVNVGLTTVDRQPTVDAVTSFPVPLDNLITYVKTLHPAGGPLDNLADAVGVGERLDEQSDALIGHFVDQARRSGASWSQIGQSMGVSKQAAQKRFVPRWDAGDPVSEGQLFSRFTLRSRGALAAACEIAGDGPVEAAHIVVGLLHEPDGLAAKIMHAAGNRDDQIGSAFGLRLGAPGNAEPAALRGIAFGDSAKELLRGTLEAVLRLGHNYVGTEHLLLGALFAGEAAAGVLESLGITVEVVEHGITRFVEQVQADRRGASS